MPTIYVTTGQHEDLRMAKAILGADSYSEILELLRRYPFLVGETFVEWAQRAKFDLLSQD